MTQRALLVLSLFLGVCVLPTFAEEDATGPQKLATTGEKKSDDKAESEEPDSAKKEGSTSSSDDESGDKKNTPEDKKSDEDPPKSNDDDLKKPSKSEKKDAKAAQEFKPLWMKPGKYFQGRKKADHKPAALEMHGQVLSSWVQRMQKVTYVAWKEQTVLTRTKSGQSKETLGLAFFRSEKGTCYISPAEPKSLKLGSYYMVVPGVEEVKKGDQKEIRRLRQDLGLHPWAKELKCKNPKRVLIAIAAFDLKAAWE